MSIKPPTVLTNLQRGNVKQENPLLTHQRTLHELAAQGYGQNSTVEFLLKSGANPNHKSSGGKTALMFAASHGFLHVVKTLINKNVNLNDVDDVGNSALMYAAHQNHALVVQELVKNRADLSIMNVNGQTAYSIALTKQNKSAQTSIEAHLVSLFKGHGSNSRWI